MEIRINFPSIKMLMFQISLHAVLTLRSSLSPFLCLVHETDQSAEIALAALIHARKCGKWKQNAFNIERVVVFGNTNTFIRRLCWPLFENDTVRKTHESYWRRPMPHSVRLVSNFIFNIFGRISLHFDLRKGNAIFREQSNVHFGIA